MFESHEGDDRRRRGIRLEIEPGGPGILVLIAWCGDRLIDCKAGAADTILDRAKAWYGKDSTGERIF